MATETAELLAGPELDALMAEKVMGWHRETARGYAEPGYVWWKQWTSERVRSGLVRPAEWSPSTDIAAAWEVFRSRRLTGQVIGYTPQSPAQRPDLTDIDSSGWAFEWGCTANGVPVHAPTAPLAICRAALQSIG